MPPRKSLPVAALLVAVFNLILFVPCLCCSGVGVVAGAALGDGSAFFSDPKMKEDMKKNQEEMEKAIPNQKVIGIGFNIINVVASIMMVTAAIGLLMKQSWGRMLCILGGLLIALATFAHVIYQAVAVVPVMSKIQEEQMKKQPGGPALGQGFFQGASYIGLVIQAAIVGGYPLLAVALMMTGPVRTFYSGAGAVRRDDIIEDDRDIDHEDDYDQRQRDDYDR